MKPSAVAADKIEEDGALAEPGYDAWKRRKVERAKAQAEDRESRSLRSRSGAISGLNVNFTQGARAI